MPRVFLSYSRKDRNTVNLIKADLETMGAVIWLDENEIEPGDDFMEKIDRALSLSEYCEVAPDRGTAGTVC